MDDVIPQARLDAIRAVGGIVASAEGRAWMKGNGYTSRTPIVAAGADEPILDVLRRVDAHGGAPVVLAVHFPERDKPDHVELASWTSKGDGTMETLRVSAGTPDRPLTAGMLMDALRGHGQMDAVATRMLQEASQGLSAYL